MRNKLSIGFVAGLLSMASPHVLAQAAPELSLDELPDIARDLLDEAAKKGDPAAVNAVADATKAVLPTFSEGIDTYRTYMIEQLAAGTLSVDGVSIATVEGAADAGVIVEATTENVVEEAAEEVEKPSGGLFAFGPWEGKIFGGASNASGNSQNTSIGFGLDAQRVAGKYTHNVTAYADFASTPIPLLDDDGAVVVDEDGVTIQDRQQTQRRWGAAYKLDYLIRERLYAFGRASYDEDAFSGFDYRLGGSFGAGYFISKSDRLIWKVEAGPGYQYSPIDNTDEVLSNFALYGASETDWTIREGLLFEQDFRVTWTSPTTTFQSVTSISAALTEAFSVGGAFEVRHETNPPAGFVNTDTILRANVSYGF